ncbi:monocopper oxidase-like protein SKS1 [Euphorbia lathyris]|uniref:monocopper oxidase-like protein SKS1 n=1 Tax=Euphorbia lathyris TaxID=212925 RepID=UPI003313FF79
MYPSMARCVIIVLATLLSVANGIDIFLEWNVAIAYNIIPLALNQPVITINGMFPGPLINATTNDIVHLNVFNNLDEPLLFTWNGIQQRLNSWQDGVSGTNCPIKPGTNWTYVFQTKDQIGSFFYFPSLNFQKAAGGFGPIRVNNRNVISIPFPKPEAEFDLLIGDWRYDNYKDIRGMADTGVAYETRVDTILMNGKDVYDYDSLMYLNVTKGKTYRLRISNVGSAMSLNFRIEKHKMELVETEGSYTNQLVLDSIDVHVGQSYSVLVTMDQDESDYYIVATPLLFNNTSLSPFAGVGALHYMNSNSQVQGPLPAGPDPFDKAFSINQTKSIRWNMTAGAARPNPQGTFNVSNVNITQTFILETSQVVIGNKSVYAVNNVSYFTPNTPLKLADYFVNGSNVYQLDSFPVDSVNAEAAYGVSVVTGNHKGWIELVFLNQFDIIDSWHFDGFGFYVVGLGNGGWGEEARESYNLLDPVVRSTVQVYPKGWTAVYAFLDNPGMWNLRSQRLTNWYLGQEMYIRVHDDDPNPAKERPPPSNLLLCGIFEDEGNATAPSPAPLPW